MSEPFKTLLVKMSLFMMAISIYVMVTAESANAETETLNISTNNDVTRLFPNPVIGASFSPNSLTLTVKSDQSGFEDASSNLLLQTNIPSAVVTNVPYTITLTGNRTECLDVSNINPVQQHDFVDAYLEGELLMVDEPIQISHFTNSSEPNKSSNHLLSFHFKGFDEIVTRHQVSSCSGQISVDIGVDI